MALTKNVNGKRVRLSAEEEAEVRAAWRAADAEAAKPKPLSLEARVTALEQQLAALLAASVK